MVLIGSISPVRGVLLFITQLLGGIIAAALTLALTPGELAVSTELNPTMSYAQGTILEMILTMQLVFTIFMLAAEKHTGTFIAPVGIGLSLFIGELVGTSSVLIFIFSCAVMHCHLPEISANHSPQGSSGPAAPSTPPAPSVPP